MTTQTIIGNAISNDTTAFIVTKENMTKAKDMLQACLEQSAPCIENGVVKGYSNDFNETEVSAFIASIDNQLKSNGYDFSAGKPSPFLVKFCVIDGEVDVAKCATVLSTDHQSAFQQAVRDESGNEIACVTSEYHFGSGCAYAYRFVSSVLLTEAEYAVFKKHSV